MAGSAGHEEHGRGGNAENSGKSGKGGNPGKSGKAGNTGNATASSPPCGECENYKKTIDDNEDRINDLLKIIEECNLKYSGLEARSDQLTHKMSNILEASGDLECVNDPNANYSLAQDFEYRLHRKDWLNLCDQMEDAGFKSDEIERMAYINTFMKKAYSMCKKYADDKMRQFLCLGPDDTLPQQSKEADLYRIRRLYGQKKETRAKVRSELSEKLFEEESDLVKDFKEFQEIKTSLQAFIEDFVEACWKMIIANPEIVLDFDVEQQPYEGVKDRFLQYANQEPLIDPELDAVMVKMVVWPCVQNASAQHDVNNANYYWKGEVITVSRKANPKM